MSTNSVIERGLQHLPQEVWLEILSWLTCERDAVLEENERGGFRFQRRIPEARIVLNNTEADLRNLCLTCRFLNFNTQPALYECFDQDVKEPRSLLLFLRSLLRQPNFALHVRRVYAHFLRSDLARFYGRRLDGEVGSLFTSVLKRHHSMGDSTRSQFLKLFHVGCTMGDTLMVLLLWHTPNLRELYIEHEDGRGYSMLEELILKAFVHPDSCLPFSKLQKLRIWFHLSHNFSPVSPWLLLPSLRSLDVGHLYAFPCIPALQDLESLRWRVDSTRPSIGLPKFTSSLTSLAIHCDDMTPDALDDILFYCTALKSFELYLRPYRAKNLAQFNLYRTLQSLLCRKDSLNILRLDGMWSIENPGGHFIRGTEMETREHGKHLPSPVSFRDFAKLTHLLVPEPALHDWLTDYRADILPPTLEVLELPTFEIGSRAEIDELVKELASEGSKQCPRLEVITFGLKGRDVGSIRGILTIRFNQWGYRVEAQNAIGEFVAVDDLALPIDSEGV
ncbi:hypothetical protein BU16DRAFT_555653 [Lophium mytilinum]|uniref:F-box domain-containing protein n=1 Tax=Lophium mytilinum TaxID=390894 RepID=A0A6A6RBN2_9PEZI|nr:hypothetical protein BU16DRAFT_555653 [Lophium mytilinum]